MHIEITGPPAAIEDLLKHPSLAGAKRHDKRGLVWITLSEMPDEVPGLAFFHGCKVHDGGGADAQ